MKKNENTDAHKTRLERDDLSPSSEERGLKASLEEKYPDSAKKHRSYYERKEARAPGFTKGSILNEDCAPDGSPIRNRTPGTKSAHKS